MGYKQVEVISDKKDIFECDDLSIDEMIKQLESIKLKGATHLGIRYPDYGEYKVKYYYNKKQKIKDVESK